MSHKDDKKEMAKKRLRCRYKIREQNIIVANPCSYFCHGEVRREASRI